MKGKHLQRNIVNHISRLISVLLLICLILGIMTASPLASAEKYNEFTYEIKNGEAIITGFNGSGNVTIPAEINGHEVTEIGVRAFMAKQSLTGVVIPDSVVKIDDYAFSNCASLKTVTIGNGVTEIGESAFMTCGGLTDLQLGNNLKKIGSAAFGDCNSLDELIIPDSVERIEDNAFSSCNSLKKVMIGNGLAFLGHNPFSVCYSLNEISVDPRNECYTVIDNVLYSKDVTSLVSCPGAKTEIDFPGSVTEILSDAFSGCRNLKEVTIPESISIIGRFAFADCQSLSDFTIPDTVTEIGGFAFAQCTSLNDISIGTGITKISENLFFNCSSLTSLVIPDDITLIERRAFRECNSLVSITIGKGVTSIGEDAFEKCSSLTDIYFGGSEDEWDAIAQNVEIPNGAVVHFSGGMSDRPNRFTDVKPGAFYADAVLWAVENEITTGTSKTTFSPDDGCTRGQVVTFLWRSATSPTSETQNNPFSDVKTTDYFFRPVLWALENKITKGTTVNKFSPSDVCTRGQIVTFLWRAAGEPEPSQKDNPFDDVKDSDFFYKAVLWAVENDITRGTSASKFSPAETCTRGQVVTFLFRSKT